MSPLVSLQGGGGWHCPPGQRCLQATIGAGGGGALSLPNLDPPAPWLWILIMFLNVFYEARMKRGQWGLGWRWGGTWGPPPQAPPAPGRAGQGAAACTCLHIPACSLDGINILKKKNPKQLPASASCLSFPPALRSQGMGFVLKTFYWSDDILRRSPGTSEQHPAGGWGKVPALGAAPPTPPSAAGPPRTAVTAIGAAGALQRDTG